MTCLPQYSPSVFDVQLVRGELEMKHFLNAKNNDEMLLEMINVDKMAKLSPADGQDNVERISHHVNNNMVSVRRHWDRVQPTG